MSPTTIALIIGLVEEAVKNYPAISADLKAIFAKSDPTPADWQAIRDKVLSQTYEQLIPNTKL